ncbi:MAG: hypothetical protein PHW74_00315 [Desulfobacca sp.]|nr:hypothetical protein [Desulfobacca sp.]
MTNQEALYPPNVKTEGFTDIQALQRAAEKDNLLLPAQYNRGTTARPACSDCEEALLPRSL